MGRKENRVKPNIIVLIGKIQTILMPVKMAAREFDQKTDLSKVSDPTEDGERRALNHSLDAVREVLKEAAIAEKELKKLKELKF